MKYFKRLTIIVAMVGLISCIVYLSKMFLVSRRSAPIVADLSACIQNLKDVGTAVQLYTSDYDDKLPPYYAFSETPDKGSDDLKNALAKYTRQPNWICPDDKSGNSGTLGYVNSHSLMILIPKFADGKRVLSLAADVLEPAKTPYLRDPVRGRGDTITPEGVKSDFLASPHGKGFVISYLDSHVSAKTPLDLNVDL